MNNLNNDGYEKVKLKYFNSINIEYDNLSYSLNDAISLIKKEQKVKEALMEGNEINLERLTSLENKSRLTKRIENNKNKLIRLIKQIEIKNEELETKKENNTIKKQILEYNNNLLQAHLSTLLEQKEYFKHTCILNQDQNRMCKERISILVKELCSVFPIEKCSDVPHIYHLRNIKLRIPLDSVLYFKHLAYPCCQLLSTDQEIMNINIALGYLSIIINLLAKYIQVELLYPIMSFGSNSLIYDPTDTTTYNEFPLYLNNKVNRKDFQTGIFLLNKNVEQLLNSQNLWTTCINNPLENLNWLMQELMSPS